MVISQLMAHISTLNPVEGITPARLLNLTLTPPVGFGSGEMVGTGETFNPQYWPNFPSGSPFAFN